MIIPDDYKIIVEIIKEGSSVLDLGCGNGDLLSVLIEKKGIKGQGIEIDEGAIYSCVAKGLNVFHDDLDNGLIDYSDLSFDYIIINQTLQELRNPHVVLKEALRVGIHAIVGFPNFAYWRARFQLFFLGKAPVTPSLPHKWYDTPNLHFLSISDFTDYCSENGIKIKKVYFFPSNLLTTLRPNIFALSAIFLISNK
ncbi:MAG TPA: methionine biosynthesis protein MetW [Nitrospirae bacterium]|nr:methionine biosynthesis protein MetW [Nitrospirota bacterium]